MDYKSVVYNAARDGNLSRLKYYLHGNKGKEEVSMLVAAKTSGATPLVIACRNGHYDVAEYLIERCHADIEQPGSVMFDGETIEGAPPLWCAAAAGHLDIVKLLISHGAKVNSTTRTNSTPLRAACFDGHLDIVKYLVQHGADIEVANRHGHSCLMIACYKGHIQIARYLLSLKASVNRKSVKGNTALHDCAESGSLEILKLLIDNGATMDVDSYGMTPLLAAAVTGHNHIVEYLIKLPHLVSRKEKIDALELLGATLVDKKRDMVGALEVWKRAMHYRYHSDGPPILKPRIQKVPAYDYVVEISDLDALDDLMADPDEMRMQALVMRERILGPAHPDTSYYIRYRGAVYADAGKFNRCIELWNYALDMQQSMLERLNPMTQSSLFSFTELFSFIMGEEGKHTTRGRLVPPVDVVEILRVFKKAVEEVELGSQMLEKMPNVERDMTYLTRVLVITLHLACLLTRMLEHHATTEAITKEIYKAVYDLVKLKIRGRSGRTALHLACCRDAALLGRYPACQFPSAHLAEVLLKVGADPNVKDDDGNTPFHLAAMARPCPANIAQVLLKHGAHIDLVNNNGETFASLLKGQQVHELVNTAKYTGLSCAAARIIQQFKIPYKGIVPAALESFIACH
ncbi:protein fem-1 homolog CG6966 isoform X1 [Tribolium madens]|uniref:protein fem-1 homolog CG6966 isoform X1 n=2 Tax=Tribolium madens TaxID=41895 RepID=UPI001CF736DC|nr:protein fem-1 homolog CG6966 isoform X1 [Tribolium madens]